MINYISLLPNPYGDQFNPEIITGCQDKSIVDFVITEMKEFEIISNVHIDDIKVVLNQHEVDINNHMMNINFKKKDMDSIKPGKFKYITDGRYGEIIFTITVSTNLNSKTIEKRILIPLEYDGFYYNNGKRMKALWQIVDEATYSQRGKNTLKSRMPVIIYQNKRRIITDVEGNDHIVTSYSYALNGKQRKSPYSPSGKKPKAKFINPLMIYSAKMGYANTLAFFGMKDIVKVIMTYTEEDLVDNYIFEIDDVLISVNKKLFDSYDMIRAFVCMSYNLRSPKGFKVTYENLNNLKYWICRIGTVGAAKNKNIDSFLEKGTTNILMIERLLNTVTQQSLRLPNYYKQNIYYLLYWLITNFDELRRYTNTDMRSKRIRRNEYIVNSSLGRKISENIHKLIEKKGKSKMNNMDTLLELFNFGSDIIVAGMRNLNDLIKTDDLVNDMDFLQSIAFSMKGPNSLGDNNNKMIAVKYRFLDPSMIGVLDLNVSSNSDIGMSGSFTPFVKLYDGYFFTPEHQPCQNRWIFEKNMIAEGVREDTHIDTFDDYIKQVEENDPFLEYLKPSLITIREKTPEELKRSSAKLKVIK